MEQLIQNLPDCCCGNNSSAFSVEEREFGGMTYKVVVCNSCGRVQFVIPCSERLNDLESELEDLRDRVDAMEREKLENASLALSAEDVDDIIQRGLARQVDIAEGH